MEHSKRRRSHLDRELNRVQKELDLLHMSEAPEEGGD